VFLPKDRSTGIGVGQTETFTKQPSEKYAIGFDYTDRLPTGRSVSTAAVSAIIISSGADATSTVIDTPTATISGSQVQFTIKAGTTAVDYKITVVPTLDNGHTFEDDLTMKVLAV
jgi:hypothetical protein